MLATVSSNIFSNKYQPIYRLAGRAKKIWTYLTQNSSSSKKVKSEYTATNSAPNSSNRCDYVTPHDDIRDELGGVSCWRETWNGTDYCIWHAEEYGKPTNELADRRLNRPERIDQPHLCGVTSGDDISFEDCQLWKAKFNSSRLSGAIFTGCFLHRADFTGTHIDDADFTDCHADHAVFQNIEGRGAQFTDASLVHADLSTETRVAGGLGFADFENADLFDATFRNTYLQQADFSDSRLTHVTFVDRSCVGDC
ncbi:pentapeptide repeat-containing protein [Haloarcula amylolytica]|uniref:pentapeptide repeat-containing protein n=1 Tax=Haloarcula amylolytica TaxID=396317 RepID=UPI0009B5CB53|nr:pentapeptide repeat-containing protein [Haloarcula amylolytica]